MSVISDSFSDHGFDDPDYVDKKEYENFKAEYAAILSRREMRWTKLTSKQELRRGMKLKRFCRKGIPEDIRGQMWMALCGADEQMHSNPGVYAAAVKGSPPDKIANVILADIPRTFPENIFFRNPDNPDTKLKSLQRVLTAFAVKFPRIGYCQGLNYVTAILLLVLRGTVDEVEEKAFWLLDGLINRILPPYYVDGMQQLKVDCMVFGELLRTKYPDIYDIVMNSGVNFIVLCTKWFICLFADVLPIETTLRVFDCLFYEGDKILFRACLALVKLHHEQLLRCHEVPELITAFRQMCLDKQTLRCHEFMRAMFSLPGSLKRTKITRLRGQCSAKLSAEESSRSARP
ncbi:unnamed protein product [Calicophoron daubneyi]|uniref:Growth hormone-regulated TBC protein 1 n=1 Tax=Calicophoron daubneyi TaxID=300641 RepID=A0AAV2TL05_CALDB